VRALARLKNRIIASVLALISFAALLVPVVGYAEDLATAAVKPVPVECYASINNTWTLIDTVTVSEDIKADAFGGSANSTRYYITPERLQEIYGDFGFDASSYDGSLIFAHTDSNGPDTVWADTNAYKSEDMGTYLIPLGFSDKGRDREYLYYLPNGAVTSGGTTVTSFKTGNGDGYNINRTNNFYSVKAADPNDYLTDEQKESLPPVTYVPTGKGTEITLPYADGVNYTSLDASNLTDLKYTQTVDTENNTVTVSVENINQNVYIVTSKPDEPLKAVVTCYVAVDGKWQAVADYKTSNQKSLSGKTRYYMTSQEFETVYSKYGFTSDGFNGERFFAHTDNYDPNNIWADAVPAFDGTVYDIPLSHRPQISLYYVPANSEGNSAYFASSAKITDADILTANSFFNVTFADNYNVLPSDKTLPEDMLLFSGDTLSVTLPLLDGEADYKIINPLTNKAVSAERTENADDKTVTITIKNISCPVKISTTTGMPTVVYHASIADKLVDLSETKVAMQNVVEDGSVKGQTDYYEELPAGNADYTLLDVDNDAARVVRTGAVSKDRHFIYTFVGWKIGNSDTVYNAGDSVSKSVLKNAAVDDEVEITSVWKVADANGRLSSLNFYVNLDCEIIDNMGNGFVETHMDEYTDSLYATRLLNTDAIPVSSTGYNSLNIKIIAPPTDKDTAYSVDKALRNSSAEPLDYGVSVENFPSDESVLSQIRESDTVISLEGHEIPHEYITPEFFTVRWDNLKYEKSDGWHIDGILVVKQGRLVVTKNFAGDSSAIKQIKENGFGITVSHESDGTSVTDYVLSLNSAADETDSSKLGYTAYDAETDTYIWSMIVRQGRDYTVKEENYTLDMTKWNNTNRYTIMNAPVRAVGWQDYDPENGVEITAEAYPNDVPDMSCQVVAFQNMYVQAGLMTVSKVDSITGNGLKNVEFKIYKTDTSKISLYRKPGTSEYSTDTNAVKEGYTENIDDNTLITDANGFFYIKLGIHGEGKLQEDYYLAETIPTGYEGPKYIKVTVTDMGKVELAQEVLDASTPSNGESWLEGEGTAILTVKNRSKLLTSVKAVKQWENTENKEPVTVELYRNGAKLNDAEYTQVLSEANNWEYEWHGLPLFIDGSPAKYTLKESKVGSTSYDPDADEDGYLEYMVTYDAALYREGTQGEYSSKVTWYDEDGVSHYADHALLSVHNVRNKGIISFSKVDEAGNALSGAKFGLYSDEACTVLLEEVTSDEYGFVVFSQRTGGTYYIKEIEAPFNYELSDTVYKAVVRGGVATITVNGGTDTVTEIVNKYTGGTENFSFIKTNFDKTPLGMARFALYKLECTDSSHNHTDELLKVNSLGDITDTGQSCWTLVAKESSVNNIGYVSFEELNAKGIYRLVEYEAPDGYQTPEGQWALTFDTTGKTAEPVIRAIGKAPAFEKIDSGIAPYRLYNYVKGDLPVSGNIGIYRFVAIGLTLMAAGTAAIILQKRPKRRYK